MKSHASDLLELASVIYFDAIAKCTALKSDQRDLRTIRSRVEHEGLSFLTITLPSFGADFDRSLAEGKIGSDRFKSFKKRQAIPAFLQGMLSQVFDVDTGSLLPVPSIEAVEGCRQIAYSFKKLRLACVPHRIRKAYQGFLEDERSLSEPLRQADIQYFSDVCDVLWERVIGSVEFDTAYGLLPKHGPGATAERISGNRKYASKRWHERLEPYFPSDAYLVANATFCNRKGFQDVQLVSRDDEQPVRVITVPKTLKAPRIIAIEPVCNQYAQQAISSVLIATLETHDLTSGHINFSDQGINRELALSASSDRQMATLDLSSASDRVPLSLATCMFKSNQDLLGAILACRSTRAQLPDRTINVRKFASMGSALCFPIEAMYFYTICVAALLREQKLPVTYRNVKNVTRHVYVYGDDIIVPQNRAEAVAEHLHKYYCKVNMSKSYWTGGFRESCGIDAYNGEEVTPTYVRRLRPSDRRSPDTLISWVKSANLFYKRGYWKTASHMFDVCESILGKLPMVGPRCAGLGRTSFLGRLSSERWNKAIQANEVKAWCPSPVYQEDKLDGDAALLKCLLKLERSSHGGEVEPTDEQHLSRSARHGAVTLKRRWVQPY